MAFPDEEIIVTDIAGDYARVHSTSLAKGRALKCMGFIEADDRLVLPLDSTETRILLVARLVDLDALFSVGPGWSPAELIEYYREQGLVGGSFRVIAWKDPENYLITRR